MSTSGGGSINAALFIVVIALAVQAGMVLLAGRRPSLTPVAVGLWLLVAIPSVVQFRFPALLTSLRRDPELVRHHGQVWRVLTSVLVQDGGWPGTIFNLIVLAVVAVFAAQVWGPLLTPVVFLLSHLVFGICAVFLSPDVGAGNSGATLGLAAATVAAAPLLRSEKALWVRAFGVLVAGAVLVARQDAHGLAVLGGLLIGAVFVLAGEPGGKLWQTRQHHAQG